ATTEWDLLVYLARQEDFDVFVQGQTLHFQPAAQSDERRVVLRPEDAVDLRLERSLTLARGIEVVVKSWNSRSNSGFVQRAHAVGDNGSQRSRRDRQQFILVQPNLTPDAALRLAQRKLTELTRHERIARISMPGELTLSPRSTIALQGTGT